MRQNKGPASLVLTALKMHGFESDDGGMFSLENRHTDSKRSMVYIEDDI